MSAIAEAETVTLDTPTVSAAVVTLTFAVLAGTALGALPQEGNLGGALDAVKNVIYVLTVPLFDLSRRLFARRKTARAADVAPAPASPNLLGTAFVTALVLFILIELISWLTGFRMGSVCALFGQQGQITDFGQCLTLGIGVFGTVLIAPIMIALGASAGWMWKGLLHGGLLTTLGTGLVLLTGGHRVLAGELSLGQLLVFLGYLTTVQTQLRTLAGVFPAARTIGASVDRVMQVLSAPPEVSDRADAQPLARAVGHVRFEGVTFGYEPGRPVLREVTMEARPGEVIAIVGQTGAGKSTLAHLIPRLFDPWSGRVIIDGSDASAWRLDDLRRQVAVVMQDSVLFPISIAENIAYGRPDATRDQVIAAARAAEAHGFIDCLPDGYDTVVGERGGTLSGGERQRIAIARALLIDAPILILDEPTSNLDARTERALLGAIERLMAGRTTFIVAHRHSTIRHADQILLLESGRVRRLDTDRTRALTQRPIVSVEATT